MSYYKCKSITKKDNKIFTCVASSNLYPIRYENYEYGENNKETIQNLIYDIKSGNIHLQSSKCLAKWQYAILKASEDFVNLKEEYKESYYDLLHNHDTIYYCGYENGKTPYSYIERKKVELKENEITSDFILEYESKYTTEKQYYNINERKIDNARIEQTKNDFYNLFMKYFNEEDTKELYTLYSSEYGYVKPTKKGFKYTGKYVGDYYKGKGIISGTYKEMYCKSKECNLQDIEIQRVIMNNEDIKKELEKMEKQNVIDNKTIIEIIEDIKKYKNDCFEIEKYYLQKIMKLLEIKINIPKNLKYITKNGYCYNGKLTYKSRTNIENIKNAIQKFDLTKIEI